MDPEMEEELESPSAGTGLETPGQQGPPNEGTWEQRRTTANGFLTAGVHSSQGGRAPSITPGTINKHENFCRHLFDSCYPRKPQAQDT